MQSGKNTVRNLQYGPQTQLIRAVFIIIFISDCFHEMCEIWSTLEESFEQVGYSLELKPVWEGNNFWVVSRELELMMFLSYEQQLEVRCFPI